MAGIWKLKVTLGIRALGCAVSVTNAQEFNVCMGNGGGTSCQAGANVNMTCAEYRGIGGEEHQRPQRWGNDYASITMLIITSSSCRTT